MRAKRAPIHWLATISARGASPRLGEDLTAIARIAGKLASVAGPVAIAVLVVALAGLIAAASYGAIQEPKVQSVMALDARNGRVAFSIGHEVLVTDETGRPLFTLERAPGVAWQFSEVSNVTLDESGRIFVADASNRSLLRFEPDGRSGVAVPLDDVPRLSFESAASQTSLVVADTMTHQLRLVDGSGHTLKSRRIGYPNGITALQSPEGFRWVVAETGMVRARAFDADLEPVEYEPVKILNSILARDPGASELLGTTYVPRWSELLDVAATPTAFAAAVCRDDSGDCSVLRIDAQTHKAEVVADVGFISTAGAEDSDGILLLSEIALTSTGRVLIASPRLSTILQFDGPGGSPPGNFCRRCTREELDRAPANLSQLETGVTWRNGARVSVFGDPGVRQKFQQKRTARNFYVALQRWGQRGTVAIAVLLLLALGVMRQTGADQRHHKVGLGQLIQGDGQALASALLIISAAAAIGGCLGYALIGWGGAIGGVAAFGGLASRFLVVRLLLRKRQVDAAKRAYEAFLGVNAKRPLLSVAGESVLWVRFASPRIELGKLITDFRESFSIDDPLEAIETIVPRLVLMAVTTERLIIANSSMLGTPLGTVVSRRWDPQSQPPSVPPSSFIFHDGLRERRFELAGGGRLNEARARTLPPVYLCERCRHVLGTCDHRPTARWLTGLLTLVLPGLGHLAQGRFRGARVAGMAGMGLLIQALHEYGPQHWGIVPANPSAYQKPMMAYAALLIATLVEALIVANRDHARCESNQRELAQTPQTAE